jgi:hypothetical protein
MLNNTELNGVVIKSIKNNLKAANEMNGEIDLNNNERCVKDRNVPSEYKFSFDNTKKFNGNYLNTDDRSEQEASTSASAASAAAVAAENISILRPLQLNVNNEFYCSKQKLAINHYLNGNNGAIKRGCEDVENECEDDLITSISSSNSSSSRQSPPKKPKFVVTSEEMNEYFNLLHQTEIQHFLKRDACCLISDKVK